MKRGEAFRDWSWAATWMGGRHVRTDLELLRRYMRQPCPGTAGQKSRLYPTPSSYGSASCVISWSRWCDARWWQPAIQSAASL